MPKLKNFTETQVTTITDAAEALTQQLHELNKYLENGYCDDLSVPDEVARSMLSLSLASGRATQMMLHKGYVQAQVREIEARRLELSALRTKAAE